MSGEVTPDPSQRQVMVNLGNRTVLFGPSAALRHVSHFAPEDDAQVLPPVADEREVAEERIARTLRVSEFESIRPASEGPGFDIEAIDRSGRKILIDIKVRERDPKPRDFDDQYRRLQTMSSSQDGAVAEAWHFNIERLKLVIMSLDKGGMPAFSTLVPLDVWQRTDKEIFRRQQVVERVEDWVRRIDQLYSDIQSWLVSHHDLKTERTRKTLMSEELMQKYAVPDRELPILDILRGNESLLSFVPRALYIIGARGRIDIISTSGTRLLIDQGVSGKPDWRLVSAESRRETSAFDQAALNVLVVQQ
ncbi:MAG: hypothetical protein KF694_04060 [Mesorhizobium sp.]|nr:hypothetical protein [Mesorhizobium sp.]